jgi:succinoglycan biosynthesis protein ExoA
MQGDARRRYSVIVPAPSIDPKPPVLIDLETLARTLSLEVLVATGSNPSRQRNLAVAQARGDWLVFLDSDCRLERVYFDRIAKHADKGLEIFGGPVLLRATATPLEVTFQSLLGHPLLTGASSSRYRTTGNMRKCDDAELILCNLAVRRDLFLKSTGFREQLYPNEENEWLTRMRANGVDCWHDPELVVQRSQRKSWRAFCRMLIRYGRGRTRQFLVSGKWDVVRQLPALTLLAWLAFFVSNPRAAAKVFLAAWLGLCAACKVFPRRPLPTTTALVAPTAPFLYAAGQVMEFLHPTFQKPAGDVQIYRWEEQFRALVPITWQELGRERTTS